MNRSAPPKVGPVALRLCAIVKERPGIHFRGLARAANVSSTGQLRHHLDRLGRRGAVIEVEDGRFKRFFVPGDHDTRVRNGLARFARRVPNAIARLLLERSMNRTELRRSLGCADSTLGFHLTRMVNLGDVVRTPGPACCQYSLQDPAFVRGILQEQGRRSQDGPASAAATAPETPSAPSIEAESHGDGPLDPPQPPQPAMPFPPFAADDHEAADPWAAT